MCDCGKSVIWRIVAASFNYIINCCCSCVFSSSGQRCLTCQHAYVGLSAVCTPSRCPLCHCNNSKQQKVASRKLVRNKMQKGHRKPRSLRRPQKPSLRFDRAPALETITEKRKWNRAAKVEVVQTAAKRGRARRGALGQESGM